MQRAAAVKSLSCVMWPLICLDVCMCRFPHATVCSLQAPLYSSAQANGFSSGPESLLADEQWAGEFAGGQFVCNLRLDDCHLQTAGCRRRRRGLRKGAAADNCVHLVLNVWPVAELAGALLPRHVLRMHPSTRSQCKPVRSYTRERLCQERSFHGKESWAGAVGVGVSALKTLMACADGQPGAGRGTGWHAAESVPAELGGPGSARAAAQRHCRGRRSGDWRARRAGVDSD